MEFQVTNLFASQLKADSEEKNFTRHVNAFYSKVNTRKAGKPALIAYSKELAESLQIHKIDQDFIETFVGNEPIPEAVSYAMCYGGHQFGHWAGQLGDGRAINIADIKVRDQNYTLQLKGAGPTPYSRSADGLAVLRSSIREFICSEAMQYLGVPTTRALSVIETGDEVLRDMMYNGNAAYEKGAVVCRAAPSFIRFGNFEIFASRKDEVSLMEIVDFTIINYFPHLGSPNKEVYVQFLKEVANTTLDMVIHWQRVGFVHGVMNTDNMSILGLTIDYGPYGWLEDFDLGWTPNTTDGEGKRYAYGNQPSIAMWNVMKLMNAIYPLINETEPLQKILDEYKESFAIKYATMMSEKLGLEALTDENRKLIQNLIKILQNEKLDYTIFFRNLSLIDKGVKYNSIPDFIRFASYNEVMDLERELINWLNHYSIQLVENSFDDNVKKERMNKVNPKYVFRNYMAHLAIEKADNGDYSLVHDFLELLKKPYDDQPEHDQWFAKRPEWARVKIGCSMLSCSS